MVGFTGGFDERLSGRDNLFLRSALFGLERGHTEALLPDVVKFAELCEVIDHPVSTYSSGMKARLGFSLSMHLEADVFLLDEALSAGDAGFRKKATLALHERIQAVGTWVIVSHGPRALMDVCDRGYILHKGELQAEGTMEEIVSLYETL